ncbi:ABC transporter permease subunit [Neisseriaceae bacterium ESL0693]|nr:ABC transporter permease subunit [Neisseriaceae bacterium ESL0693]
MKKWIITLLAGIALPCLANEAKPLKVGIDLTYAPYAYNEHQKAQGFDPQFMRLLAQQAHQPIEFYDTRIENLIMGLTSKHYDMVASALYVNAERARQVDFIPYLQTGGVLLVRQNDTFSPQTLQDLCGKRVSMMKGAAWISLMQQVSQNHCQPRHLAPIDIRTYPTAPEASQALLSQGVDVQYEDAAVASALLHSLGNTLKITNQQLLNPVLIGLAIRKNDTETAEFLARQIKQLQQTPQYTALLGHYHLSPPDKALLTQNAPYLITDEASNLKQRADIHSGLFDYHYLITQLKNPDFIRAGLWVILLASLAWLLAAGFGLILALANRSTSRLLHHSSALYIWLFRSLPLLVLLISLYNLPRIWAASHMVLAKPFYAGLIALILSESAYMAEIHRAALQGIPSGQFEASKALGLRPLTIYRHIILPQALRLALPPLTNQFITIIKLTSLVSVISFTEILLVGQQLYTRNFKVMETLAVVAIYYMVIISLVSWLLKRWEHYLKHCRHPRKYFSFRKINITSPLQPEEPIMAVKGIADHD